MAAVPNSGCLCGGRCWGRCQKVAPISYSGGLCACDIYMDTITSDQYILTQSPKMLCTAKHQTNMARTLKSCYMHNRVCHLLWELLHIAIQTYC